NSRDEESYLAGRLSRSRLDSYWIGASDSEIEFGWVWADGSPFSYFNWAPGQPDNYKDQDCVSLNKSTMQWSDEGPSAVIGLICETKEFSVQDNSTAKPQTTPNPQVGKFYGCQAGWVSYQDSCYMIQEDRKTWIEAQGACRQNQAELASIANKLENQFIWSQIPYGCQDKNSSCPDLAQDGGCPTNASYVTVNCRKSCGLCDSACANAYSNSHCDYWASTGECTKNPFWMWPNCRLSCGCDRSINEGYWIGFNDRSSPMNFIWADNSPVTYAYWMRQEPDTSRGNKEDCVLMHKVTGEWSDEECNTASSGYVCKMPKSFLDTVTVDASKMGCSFGAVGYRGKCYVTVPTLKAWPDAKAYCERLKGHLVIVPDRRANAFLTSILFAEEKNSDSDFWIGLSATGENYSWVDGSKLNFDFWTANHTGKESDVCAALTSQGWATSPCDVQSPSICELPRRGWATTSAPTTVTATGSAAVTHPCPGGWTDFNGLCYKFMSSLKNFVQASSFCESQAASLMSLHDQETNNFLFKTLLPNKDILDNKDIWIGLQHNFQETSWVDGTPFDFQAWGDGQPNTFLIHTACGAAQTVTQDWKFTSCYERKAFVCQLQKGGLYISLPTEKETTALPSDVPLCRERTTLDPTGNAGGWHGFDPNTVGSGSSVESTAKIAQSTAAEKSQCPGMPHGSIAGIVVSVVCACAVLVTGAFVYGRKRGSLSRQQKEGSGFDSTGFNNALYAAKHHEDGGGDDLKISLDNLNSA
ncbi:hypothetical protein EGW08_007592, partial [Elysia chlorotica]